MWDSQVAVCLEEAAKAASYMTIELLNKKLFRRKYSFRTSLKPLEAELLSEVGGLDVEAEYRKLCFYDFLLRDLSEITPKEVEEFNCCIRSGTVTYLGNESGLINEHVHFDRCNAPAEIKVNDLVLLLADIIELHQKSNIIVHKVYLDEEGNNAKICRSGAQRMVTDRVGKQVVVDYGKFKFHMDTVETKFSPLTGDFVYLYMNNIPPSTAEKKVALHVDKIRWVRYRTLLGEITLWDGFSGTGQINEDVFFTKDSCALGYSPAFGDEVAVDAIKSCQGSCNWRALGVVQVHTQENLLETESECAKKIDSLCQSKDGITLTAKSFHFGVVQMTKEGILIEVKVKNIGNTPQWLMNGFPLIVHNHPQVEPVSIINQTLIKPNESITVVFKSKGLFIGPTIEIYVFRFPSFMIGCKFELEVEQQAKSRMETPTSSNKRPATYYHSLSMERNQHILSGERPIQPPKFIERRLHHYNVPDRYWLAFLNFKNTLKATPEVQKAVEKLTPCLKSNLDISSYVDRLHALLYLEELDAMLKLQRYRMERVTFKNEGECLWLDVPGLAEKRPSLLVGDIVLASQPWKGNNLSFEGFVHRTMEKGILLRFNPDFHVNNITDQFNVEFKFGRTAIRRQHAAIDLAITNLGPNILFPSKLELKCPQLYIEEQRVLGTQHCEYFYTPVVHEIPWKKIEWLNPNLNEFQKDAILNVLKGEARPLPYIIFGPPGTGKTVTLVELILKIYSLVPNSRILIATPSNSSANLITERLIESKQLQEGTMVRLVGYHVFDDGNIPKQILPYCTTGNIKMMAGEEAMPAPIGSLGQSSNKSTLGRHSIIIGTCIALGQLYTMGLEHGHFTHILVDEAGQATEPEILVPLDFLHCNGQIILAGDPMQLGPVVGSNLANQYGLGESYLDRLLHRFPYHADRISHPDREGLDPRLISCLLKNYRTVSEILELPNKLFYESKLIPQVSGTTGTELQMLYSFSYFLPQRGLPFFTPPAIVFHGVKGTNLQESESPSWFNPQEIITVLNYLVNLNCVAVNSEDIGIITPYRKQVQKMRWYFMRALPMKPPKIGSVEEFQGQEKKVIILSAVRSSSNPTSGEDDVVHSLGFVSSPKRLNVSLTRAQTLLIIVGNPHVLAKDPDWKATLQYCINNKSYVGCDVPADCMPRLQGNV